MRELVDAFYRERSLANHHIMSYNDFINYWLQDIIDKIKVGDDEAERGTITTDIEGYEVKLGKIRVGNPLVKEADGSTRLLTPMEARLRNLTYEAPMYLEFIPIIEGVEHEPEEVRIGDMPIMVKSAKCNITKENLERHEGTIFTTVASSSSKRTRWTSAATSSSTAPSVSSSRSKTSRPTA